MADRKLKKLADKAAKKAPISAKNVLDSANQIWLAGLGAFSKAQNEPRKTFDSLVKEGSRLDKKTRKNTEERVEEFRGAFQDTVSQVQSKASQSWDKLERVFEDRVGRALNGLGVPTADNIQELTKRIDELQKAVRELNKKKSTKVTAKKKATKKKVAKKKVAKKRPSKKAASKKPAAKKKVSKKAAKKKSVRKKK